MRVEKRVEKIRLTVEGCEKKKRVGESVYVMSCLRDGKG